MSRIRTKGLAVVMAGLVGFSMMPATFVFADSEITEYTIQEDNETAAGSEMKEAAETTDDAETPEAAEITDAAETPEAAEPAVASETEEAADDTDGTAAVLDGEEAVQIGTWDQLKAFIDGINDGTLTLNTNAVLTADIEVPGSVGNDWVPLACDKDHAYRGTFDGDEHKITGISVSRGYDPDHSYYPDPWIEGTKVNNYTAFLSFLDKSGVVKNLTIEASITDVNDVAGIVSQNFGTIDNCTFKGKLHSEIYPNEAGEESLFHRYGVFYDSSGESGCIAAANCGLIQNCRAEEGTVVYRGGAQCGGIVGMQIQGGVVKGCVSYAEISCKETRYQTDGKYVGGIGGIVGAQEVITWTGEGDTIQDPSWTDDKDDKGVFIPPIGVSSKLLADDSSPKPVIESCTNLGSVSCEQLVGGICGDCWGGDIIFCINLGKVDNLERNWCGGIVGYLSSNKDLGLDNGSTVRNCINHSDVNPSGYDSATGQCTGTYVGGIVGAAEDVVNEWTGKILSPVCVYDCTNFGDVTGRFGVGGTIGYISNGLVNKTTNIYELVNFGKICGNDCTGGVIGACPGVAASLINYGSVTLIPSADYCSAGGLAGSLSISGNISTSYNLGSVSKDGGESYVVYLGGVAGSGSGDLPGCYYCAETSGSAKSVNGDDPKTTGGALSLRQMSGENAKSSMPDLFDARVNYHPSTVWKTMENVVEGELTYLMTPQYQGIDFTYEEISAVVNIIDRPINLEAADVIIKTASYNGQAQTPDVTVSLNGLALTEGVDYTTDAGSYTDVGQYKINVTGIGNYYGGNSGTFEIVKGKSTITVADRTVTYTGKKVASREAKVTGSTGKVTYAYYSDKACKQKIAASKVVNAGTYYVKATVAEDNNYKSATSKAATITIRKANQKIGTVKPLKKTVASGGSYQLTTTLTKGDGKIVYEKLKGISGIKVSKTGKVTAAKGTKAKTYTVKIKVTAKGTKNYNAATVNKKLTITVK